MRKYLVLIVFCLLTISVYSQCPSSVYIPELGKYGKVESCESQKGEAINMVISFYSEETYSSGKWKIYYPNGDPKEEGFISLEASVNTTFIEPGYKSKPYVEKRVGKWLFWDQLGNQREVVYH